MIHTWKVPSLALARGGSERLAGKNVGRLCGTPLVSRPIDLVKG